MKRQLKRIVRGCGCVLEKVPNSRSRRAPRGRSRWIKFCDKHKPDRFLSGFFAGFMLGTFLGHIDIAKTIMEKKDDN